MARSPKVCACNYRGHCDCPETVPVKKIFTGDPSNPHNAKCLICLTGDTVVLEINTSAFCFESGLQPQHLSGVMIMPLDNGLLHQKRAEES